MLKKVVNNRWAQRRHKYFKKWRDFADKEEIVQICNQFGKVRQQTNNIKQDIKNLKDKLLNERFEPEHIAKIVTDDDENY